MVQKSIGLIGGSLLLLTILIGAGCSSQERGGTSAVNQQLPSKTTDQEPTNSSSDKIPDVVKNQESNENVQPYISIEKQTDPKSGLVKSAVIKNNKKIVKELKGSEVIGGTYDIKVFKQNNNFVYFEWITGRDYATAPYHLHRLNLKTNEWLDITQKYGEVDDISPNDVLLVSRVEEGIKIQNMQNNTSQVFTVDTRYDQIGKMVFSPDNKRLVYEALDSDRKEGSLYIITFASNKNNVVATSKANHALRIKKWKDSVTVDYEEIAWNEDYLGEGE